MFAIGRRRDRARDKLNRSILFRHQSLDLFGLHVPARCVTLAIDSGAPVVASRKGPGPFAGGPCDGSFEGHLAVALVLLQVSPAPQSPVRADESYASDQPHSGNCGRIELLVG